jgi:hypothetical protein
MLRNALPLLSALLIAGGAAAAAPLALDAAPGLQAQAGEVLRDLPLPERGADEPRRGDEVDAGPDPGEAPQRRDRAQRRHRKGGPDARGPRGHGRDGPKARGHHKGKGKGHAKARGKGHHKHGCEGGEDAPEAH